jgi:DNA replication and repair protein RecF
MNSLGESRFAVAGRYSEHALHFRYSTLRRQLTFDEVEQQTATEYLRIGRVVSFANTDIELVRGGAEARRRFLDFSDAQIEPMYRPTLRAYERALRSRNALLKSPQARPREVAAYDAPLLEHGAKLSQMRAGLVEKLAPFAADAHRLMSGSNETLRLCFTPGNAADFAADLARSSAQELRLRQTVVGPHRDEISLLVNEMPAAQFASEGQQRTVALALKIAQARLFAAEHELPPLLLIDDIFGELDPQRRNRFLAALPRDAQKLITATTMVWREEAADGPVFSVANGCVQLR